MVKKVRTLLRVSSRQQLHEDDIPVQRAEAEQYIAKQPDWVLDREYMEKAVSAYKNSAEDREVLQEILADAKAKQFDILLTYMSDRIGRQEEYSFYVAALNQLGIQVWTIKDGQLKTEEHVDKLLNYIRFWQNEGESKKTSMRVRDNQIELVRSGKFVGGKAPFGYRLVPSGMISNHGRLLKKLEIVEQNAVIVRKIYSLAVYQGMGYEKISKILNEEGVPAIATEKWKSATIAGILKNPIYMGFYAINRRKNQGSFTRLDRRDWIYSREQIPELVIIEQSVWERAQEIREARKAKIEASREAPCPIPFSTGGKLALTGLAYCGYCGKKLKNGSYRNRWTVKGTGEKKTSFVGQYVCPDQCRERSCYSQDYLETIVLKVAEGWLEHLQHVDVTKELEEMQSRQQSRMEKRIQDNRRVQKKTREDIETLEEKIPDAIRGDSYFSAEKLASMLGEKEKVLAALEKEEKQLQKEAQQGAGQPAPKRPAPGQPAPKLPAPESLDWKAVFQGAELPTKKMLLALLVERIEVRDGEIKIRFRIGREMVCGNASDCGMRIPENHSFPYHSV